MLKTILNAKHSLFALVGFGVLIVSGRQRIVFNLVGSVVEKIRIFKLLQGVVCSLLLLSLSCYCLAGPKGDFRQFKVDAPACYFVTPVSPYIIASGEVTHEIFANAGDVTAFQQTLDAARAAHPDAVVIIHIRVPLTVSDTPLTLGSRVCVSLEGSGQIKASENMTASALISIENAEFVSVTSDDMAATGTSLDGNNAAAYGVWVSNSGKVNLDNLAISDCTANGVYYFGRGDDQLNDAGSVTRCRISNAGVDGVWVRNGARFVLMDNTIESCGGYGIDMISQSATVLGNQCTGNQTGIRLESPVSIAGPASVAARNELELNGVGLELGGNTRRVVATENIIHQNTVGIKLAGTRNHLFNNDMDNVTEFDLGGSENIIARHDGVTSSEASGGSTKYFNPPTAANPHNDPVIVAGMGRHDITMTQSGPTPMSTDVVQPTLNNARSQHPNDVIVLWLNGTFVADGDFTGLTIPDNTCVVLDGTIYAEGAGMDATTSSDHDYEKGETTGGTQVILMTGSGYSSFSGGIIDGKDLPAYGIYAPGNHVGLIDGVRVLDANNNNIGTCSHGGDGTPLFIRGCELLGHKKVNRGVWVHVCNNVHSISNYAEGFTADAFDVDAAGHWNTVLFNTVHDNVRSGVFVEERASNNIVTGNTLTGPQGPGLLSYDAHGGASRCENNIIVANKTSCPGGLSFRHLKNSFIFNNNILENRQLKVQWSQDNYMSQNIAVDGVVDRSVPDNPYFAAPNFNAQF
jgi:hypothetical protein